MIGIFLYFQLHVTRKFISGLQKRKKREKSSTKESSLSRVTKDEKVETKETGGGHRLYMPLIQ